MIDRLPLKSKSGLRVLRHISEWTGLIYLSAFVLNTGLLWFFARKAISCTFIDEGIIYVECGHKAFEQFLEFFLLYFSPLAAPLTAIYWRYLFFLTETLNQSQLISLALFFPVSLFVMVSCLLILRKMIRGFVLRKHDRARARRSWVMLAVILIPAFISFGYRLYLMPPQWVDKQVKVDIWHGVFEVSRGALKDWTLVNKTRPERKPNEYAGSLTKWWRDVPFLTFYVPVETTHEVIEATVNPHYDVLDKAGMAVERDRLATYRINLKTEKDQKAIYPSKPRLDGKWEIYDASFHAEDLFPDIYIAKDAGGNIDHILQCTPMNACAIKVRFKWASYPCGPLSGGPGFDCNSCQRVCTDFSMGTEDYDIKYVFDRKDIEVYDGLDADIKKYIGSFYTSKK